MARIKIHVALNRGKLRAAVDVVLYHRIRSNAGNSLTGWGTISFSRGTLLHGVRAIKCPRRTSIWPCFTYSSTIKSDSSYTQFNLQILLLVDLGTDSRVLTSNTCNNGTQFGTPISKYQIRQMRLCPSTYFLAYRQLPELFGLI